MSYLKKISETSLRVGPVRFSYANVFTPRKNEDGTDGKYGVQLLIPKSDTATVAAINAAFEAAKKAGATSKWEGKIPAALKATTTPLRDGDIEKEGEEVYEGMWFINTNSPTKPGVRVRENGAISEALDSDDFYSGCWGAATINFFPYKVSGNTGVAAGLNNVIKTKDADRLGGSRSAESDFNDMVDEASSFLD
jgi:hypothetical protein